MNDVRASRPRITPLLRLAILLSDLGKWKQNLAQTSSSNLFSDLNQRGLSQLKLQSRRGRDREAGRAKVQKFEMGFGPGSFNEQQENYHQCLNDFAGYHSCFEPA